MTKLEQEIIETVVEMQGGKATEIIANLPETCFDNGADDIIQTIDHLVQTGHLVEVEYVLPQMDYRIKSFYLPANTKVTIRMNVSTVSNENEETFLVSPDDGDIDVPKIRREFSKISIRDGDYYDFVKALDLIKRFIKDI